MNRRPGAKTCNACVHWVWFGDKFTDNDGECRRHAPRPVTMPEDPEHRHSVLEGDPETEFAVDYLSNEQYIARWPWTRAWDGCGEFVRDELEEELIREEAQRV